MGRYSCGNFQMGSLGVWLDRRGPLMLVEVALVLGSFEMADMIVFLALGFHLLQSRSSVLEGLILKDYLPSFPFSSRLLFLHF